MHNRKEQSDIKRKLKILHHAEKSGNISATCRYYGLSRDTFYKWKRGYQQHGEKALINSKPCPQNPSIRVKPEIEEKILYLRKNYHFGQLTIAHHLERYHGMKVSPGGVRGVLLRHGLNRLPKNEKPRNKKQAFKRYEKQMPGRHVQVDVKFLFFKDQNGKRIKRFQYTAIDDATRIRAMKIYDRHNQETAIKFIDYVVELFPFRIKVIRTDNGHEFKTRFSWHVEDLGMIHVRIKPATPRLNGKVERSHLTDQQEFYQLLDYKGDVDLRAKLKTWENYYNFFRPHSALNGKSPFETLRLKMLAAEQKSPEAAAEPARKAGDDASGLLHVHAR